MFSFFKKKTAAEPVAAAAPVAPTTPDAAAPSGRSPWFDRLRAGLRKTGSSIAQVFTGTRIDEALYEELEAALLMADAGVKATEFLLDRPEAPGQGAAGRRTVCGQVAAGRRAGRIAGAAAKPARNSQATAPTVMMVVGVNGAGKTTSIGKLTRHLAERESKSTAGRGRHVSRRGAGAAGGVGRDATRSRSSARRAATRPR